MIGHISTGRSFYHCISYCLEDKQDLTEVQKASKSLRDGLQHKDRAEILDYNQCFGDKYDLAEQFRDVKRLSKRIEQPVLHMSVRLAPGDVLTRNQLVDLGRELAKEFGVADHQYITVLHKDCPEPHIHLVANRVGYDGRAAATSKNYLRMDRFCRRMEKEYQLQEVLSARRFLSQEQRLIPRHNLRMEKLKNDIYQTLDKVKNYDEFHQRMQALGYQVIRGRGISFVDEKKVKIKGSEVGFSLATIENTLRLKNEWKLIQRQSPVDRHTHPGSKPAAATQTKFAEWQKSKNENVPLLEIIKKIVPKPEENHMKPPGFYEGVNPALLQEARKKKKRKQQRLHL